MRDKSFHTVPFVWSRKVWFLTSLFFVLWVATSCWFVWQMRTAEDITPSLVALVLTNLVFLPTMLLCEGYAPQRLEIGASKLVILRRYDSITITTAQIRSIERLPDNALRFAVRTFGCGGLFGFFGKFYTRKIGSFSLYATRSENLYLITLLDGKKIVISCAEPELLDEFCKNELK